MSTDYEQDDDSLEDLIDSIEAGALVNGCESTELAYRTGIYKQINDFYYGRQRLCKVPERRVHAVEAPQSFSPLSVQSSLAGGSLRCHQHWCR